MTANRRRRGSTYIMVLGVATILATIGLSTLTVSRIHTRSTVQENNWLDAQIEALSAVEHALAKINTTTDWRSTFQSATVEHIAGAGTFSWRVVDEVDGDLTNNPDDPAVLNVTATVGGASYSLRVDLATSSGPAGTGGGTLWGVDEQDGELFATLDYHHIATSTTVYGPLKWNDQGMIRNVGDSIRAMTIDFDGAAYMALNASLGAYSQPVLLRFNLNQATVSGDNVVEVVGSISFNGSVNGLAIDTTTGDLYGIGNVGGNGKGHGDRLLRIGKNDPSAVTNVGEIAGLGETLRDGEDLVFDDQGSLYVIDDNGEELYRVDKSTGAITAIVDDRMALFGSFRAIAWDAANQRMLGSQTTLSLLYWVTLQPQHNVILGTFSLSGLSNVEGMAFMPAGAGGSVVRTVRPVASTSAIRRVVQ